MVKSIKELGRFTNINIYGQTGDIVVKSGDKGKIEYYYNPEYSKIEYSLNENKLEVNQKNLTNSSSRKNKNYICITIPRGVSLDEVEVKLDTGEVNITDLNTNEFEAKVVTGGLIAKNINTKSGDLSVTTGEIITDNFNSEELESRMITGTTIIKGKLLGKTDISVTTGEAIIETRESFDKYGYKFTSLIGDVKLSNGIMGKNIEDQGKYPNFIKAKVTTGSLDVKFND
ncbi:MAG: DUF4097 family beta strand repeat-containing protein [Clostridium sp.]